MTAQTIFHNRPTLGVEEHQAAERVLKSAWLAQGAEVEAFENEFCQYLGLSEGHAVAVSSGTAALFLALWVVGAKGLSIACPVLACSALVNAVKFAGAEPQFIDVASGTPNIDLHALNKSSASIAILAHMFGQPIDVAGVRGKLVIEDCAQSLGASASGKPVGLAGRVAIHSFYATKMITSGGQGGMLVSADRELVAAARDFREFDCREDRKQRFNIQMTDLQAAIGREQLKKLPLFVARRAEIFALYRQADLDLLESRENSVLVHYRIVLRTRDPRAVIDALERGGIKAIVPVEEWELLGGQEGFANARQLARTTVSLPAYPSLRDEDVDRIIEALGRLH